MQVYLKLLRVSSWVKNTLLFAPLVFSMNLLHVEYYGKLFTAFICFSLLSSCIYIINDIKDINADQLHPRKKHRPLPSKKISVGNAILIAILCFTISFILAAWVNQLYFIWVLIGYFTLNIAYIFKLKYINLLDCFSIATGFVLRVLAGCYAIEVVPSDWIVVVSFFLALFLAFGKRKSELILLDKSAGKHREVLSSYTKETLDIYIYICAVICISSYLIYTLTSETIPEHLHSYLKYSAVFVVFGIFRYIRLIHAKQETDGDPTVMFYTDRALQITILGWIIFVVLIFYLHG